MATKRIVKDGGQANQENSAKPELFPVETLAGEADLPSWQLAGLRQAAAWAVGKQITRSDFELALARFNDRPQGGGRIEVGV